MSFPSLSFAFFPGAFIGILIPVVTLVLVFSIPLVAIVTEHLTKKARMRIYEEALRRGVPLEDLPSMADADEPARRLPYRSGMVTSAVGLGIIFFSLMMARFNAGDWDAFVVLGSGGVIVLLIGVALLINDFIHRKHLYARLHGQDERGRT